MSGTVTACICPCGCGRSFTPNRPNQKYLNPSHRKKASRERLKKQGGDGLRGLFAAIGAAERGERGPLECRCNGGHFLQADQDGDHYCFKCGGSIDGWGIYRRISNEAARGKTPADIALALSRDMVPMVFGESYKGEGVFEDSSDGSLIRCGWSARAVKRVLDENEYLPRVAPLRGPLRVTGGLPTLAPPNPRQSVALFTGGGSPNISSDVTVYRGEPGKPSGPVEIRPASSFRRPKAKGKGASS